jgi:hypothetical protein
LGLAAVDIDSPKGPEGTIWKYVKIPITSKSVRPSSQIVANYSNASDWSGKNLTLKSTSACRQMRFIFVGCIYAVAAQALMAVVAHVFVIPSAKSGCKRTVTIFHDGELGEGDGEGGGGEKEEGEGGVGRGGEGLAALSMVHNPFYRVCRPAVVEKCVFTQNRGLRGFFSGSLARHVLPAGRARYV